MTRLSLTDQLLCSASLDFTARLWKRGPEMRCAAVLHLGDWVWDIAARRVHAHAYEVVTFYYLQNLTARCVLSSHLVAQH